MYIQPIETNSSSRQVASEEGTCDDMWSTAARLAMNDQEHAVLIDAFVYGLPPHAILARHPGLFEDIRAVFAAKRDLLVRFQ